jgi:hypothetical protein
MATVRITSLFLFFAVMSFAQSPRDALRTKLAGMIRTAEKPSPRLVSDLAGSLLQVMDSGRLKPADKQRLLGDVERVLNSAAIAAAEADRAIGSVLKLMVGAEINEEDRQRVASDLLAVADEARLRRAKPKPKPAPARPS